MDRLIVALFMVAVFGGLVLYVVRPMYDFINARVAAVRVIQRGR